MCAERTDRNFLCVSRLAGVVHVSDPNGAAHGLRGLAVEVEVGDERQAVGHRLAVQRIHTTEGAKLLHNSTVKTNMGCSDTSAKKLKYYFFKRRTWHLRFGAFLGCEADFDGADAVCRTRLRERGLQRIHYLKCKFKKTSFCPQVKKKTCILCTYFVIPNYTL